MKPITKIIIFLIVAFVIIFGITFAMRDAVAPAVLDEAPTATSNPVASPASSTSTLAQVALHKTQTDCWTAVGGNVFDVTAFVSRHPGGVENIIKVCGIDATAIFTAQHGSNENAQKALASLKIGTLK